MRLDPGRVAFEPIAPQMPGPTFGHLAATGIARAQEQHFLFHRTPPFKLMGQHDLE
jgi:hypothetical protein